jgi:four helix bundle protein
MTQEQDRHEKGLQNLETWKSALQFAVRVCRDIVPILPEEEKWALASQIRRSVQSVPANIAEGYGRYYYQESVRFSYIARGSLEETKSHLILAHELGYLDQKVIQELLGQADEIHRLLNGYIAFLKRTRQGSNEPGSLQHTIHESLDPYQINQSTVDQSQID